jgi:hypothetical protein
MRSDNTHHLLAAAQRRRDSTLERAQRTLRELSKTGQRYTVTDIAARAGVSRAWLYAQIGLRDQIRQLTDQRPTSPPAIDQPSAAPTRRCGNGSNSPTPASLNSTTTTVACATK